jgi:hypothetical protein
MPSYHLGLEEKLFAMPENNYGQAALPDDGRFLASEAVFTLKEDRRVRKDRKNHRSAEARIRGKRNVDWSISLSDPPAYRSGNPPTPVSPAIWPLYLTSFKDQTTVPLRILGAGENGSGPPAATGADVVTTDGSPVPRVGTLLPLRVAEGWFAVAVTAVAPSSVQQQAHLTWTPTLPSAPTAGSIIGAGYGYWLRSAPGGSLTIHRGLGDFAECIVGAIPDRYVWTLSGGDEAMLEMSGYAQDLARFEATTLAAAIDASQTTFRVARPMIAMLGGGACYFKIDPNSPGEETIAVVATDRDDPSLWTVRRGLGPNGARTHASGATLTPAYPEVTTRGEPVSGILGRVSLDGRDFEVSRAKITVQENVKMRNRSFGSAVAKGYVAPEDREVTVELEGFLVAGDGAWVKPAYMYPSPVVLQAGDQPGRMHAFYLPRVVLDMPDLDVPPDTEIPLKLSGMALVDRDTVNLGELAHAYL